jgi:hypothetical protein
MAAEVLVLAMASAAVAVLTVASKAARRIACTGLAMRISPVLSR